jgi:hypothetical protein
MTSIKKNLYRPTDPPWKMWVGVLYILHLAKIFLTIASDLGKQTYKGQASMCASIWKNLHIFWHIWNFIVNLDTMPLMYTMYMYVYVLQMVTRQCFFMLRRNLSTAEIIVCPALATGWWWHNIYVGDWSTQRDGSDTPEQDVFHSR